MIIQVDKINTVALPEKEGFMMIIKLIIINSKCL